jgi:transposase-like protein
VTEIAREAGVDPSLLYHWRRQLGKRDATTARSYQAVLA